MATAVIIYYCIGAYYPKVPLVPIGVEFQAFLGPIASLNYRNM